MLSLSWCLNRQQNRVQNLQICFDLIVFGQRSGAG